jgi:hypothetical protein
MKAFVTHDAAGRIHSIFVVAAEGKLQARPAAVAGYRVAELELPAVAGDPRSLEFHRSLRALVESHRVVGDSLVPIETRA